MAGSVITRKPPARTGFRAVFAEREFAALWLAQLASIAGDQFARIAVTVLVYDRTRSALLAALTFAVSVLPVFIGGLALGWLADKYPRRTVMIACDVASLVLVLVMTVPGVPLGVLVALLFAVTTAGAPFMAARQATNREVLGADRWQLGNAVTITTYQVAQLAGFGAGGVVAGLAGTRGALLIDAATFAASALLVAAWVKPRPAAGGARGPARPRFASGARLVFGSPVARTAVLLMWLAAFFAAPEGVAAPLARSLGGGPATVGLLLAAMTGGASAGLLLYGRLVRPSTRAKVTALLAAACCAVLAAFALSPALAGALAILAASGLCSAYIVSANGALTEAIPDESRGQAFGLTGAGLALGQGVALIAAGAAAQRISPALVIACSGTAGAALAVLLAVSWRRLLPRLARQ